MICFQVRDQEKTNSNELVVTVEIGGLGIYTHTLDKGFDESYCDMLYLTIEKKKENREAAKSWGRSTFEWLPLPAPPSAKFSSLFTYEVKFDERKHDKMIAGDVNAILYPRCSEAGRRRYYLSKESSKKR